MQHNMITAIFVSAIEAENITSGVTHFNNSMLRDCDLQKSCLEHFDPSETVSKVVFSQNIIICIIGLFGIVGNILSIIVLSKPEMKSSINYLLIGLQYCDTFVVLFAILIAGLGCILPCTGFMFNINNFILAYIYVYLQPMWYSAQFASIYMTLAITVERFIAVCYPFEAKDLCTISRAKKCNIIILVISFVYHIPTYWENGIVQVIHDECNITVTCAYATDFSKNHVYFTIYWEWLRSILTFLIPFTCLIYFNIRIIMQMEKAKQSRRKLTGCTKNEKDQTKILFCIVIVFFICNSMFPIIYIYQYLYGSQMTRVEVVLNQSAMSLFVFNSCVNFVIYIAVGRKFKKTLKKIFKKSENSSTNVRTVMLLT